MKIPVKWLVFFALAGVQALANLWLSGLGFVIAEGPGDVPAVLDCAVVVMRFPLLQMEPTIWSWLSSSGRWWGDDSNVIYGIALVNGFLWAGIAFALSSLVIVVVRRSKGVKKA